MTANITHAENNETDNDVFRKNADCDLSFLRIHGRPPENDNFWIPCY